MTHPVDLYVGRRVKQFRLKRKMSQADVAEQLRITFQQIQKYENATNRIATSRLFDIAQILDVPISAFFLGIDEDDGVSAYTDDIVAGLSRLTEEDRKKIHRQIVNMLK